MNDMEPMEISEETGVVLSDDYNRLYVAAQSALRALKLLPLVIHPEAEIAIAELEEVGVEP